MTIETFDFTGSAYRPSIAKDPNADLDYTFDFTAWLTAISDSLVPGPTPAPYVLTPVGVTIDAGALDGTRMKITVFVSGGNASGDNSLTCKITTLGGRIDERTMYFDIIQR